MIDADAELKTLEQEFPRSSRAWATDTDAVLDQRILSIADGVATYLAQMHRQKEQDLHSTWRNPNLPRPARPYASRELRTLSSKVKLPLQSPDLTASTLMRSRNSKVDTTQADAEKMLAFLQDAGQQVWLDRIADIVKAGDVELAIYLLNQYRMKFEGE